jgi:hypothetical protein
LFTLQTHFCQYLKYTFTLTFKLKIMSQLLRSLLFVLLAFTVSSYTYSQATIKTDLLDYSPGSTASITGTGWLPGETVTLQVLHEGDDGYGTDEQYHQPFTTIADANGNVSSSWWVPDDGDALGATLVLSAVGESSGLRAEWTFTDGTRILDNLEVGDQDIQVVYGTAASAKFTITVNTTSSGGGTANLNNINISISDLPTDVTYSFDPTSVDASNSTTSPTSTLTLDVPNTISVGSYVFKITASGGNGNNARTTTANGTLIISKANANISVSGIQTFPYNGNPQGPSTISYNGDGTTSLLYTNVGGTAYSSATAPTNAGNYQVVASATAGANYNSASSQAYTFTITKIDPAISVSGTQTFTYNGTAQGPSTINYNGDGTTTLLYTNVEGTAYSSATAPTNAGNYQVVVSATAGTNYNAASSAPYTFTIAQKTLHITATGINKEYDGNATATVNLSDDRVSGDDLTLNYGTATFNDKNAGTGKTVNVSGIYFTGTDAINYLGNTTASTTADITQRSITIKADAQSKTYGDADPSLIAQVINGTIVTGDVASGNLTRLTGENVGSYQINQGTYTYGSNYAETYISADLTINKRAVEITADPKSKTYGDTDPTLTYQITSGSLAFSDAFSGSLTRDAGEDVGSYAINQGSVALSSNYDLSYVGADLTINKRAVEITADPKSKTYGDTDPALTYQITSGSLAFSDAFSGSLTRNAGEDVGSYAINQGSVALSDNYTLTYVSADLTINKRVVEITADPKSKTYGDTDPALTYQITNGSLAFADAFSGSLTRDAGEDVGNYAINQGSVALSDNYTLTYVSADLTINKRAVEITADPKSKTYGDTDPALTYQITSGSLAFSDTFSGSLTRDAGESAAAGANTYAIREGNVTLNSNYILTYIGAYLTINNIPISGSASAAKINCHGESTTLTADVSGGDGTLQYSLNGGNYQTSNQFTVTASSTPYVVTVKDEDGFTFEMPGVIVTEPTLLVASAFSSNSHLYFGAPGDQSTTISTTVSGGTAPYTVTVTMDRPIILNYINSDGDETWNGNGGTTTADPVSGAPVTTITNVSAGNLNLLTVRLLDDADFTVTVTDANGCSQINTVHEIAEDARCFAGKSAIVKVSMCHVTSSAKNPRIQICVDEDAVQAHLDDGDYLGSCTIKTRDMNTTATEVSPAPLQQQEVPGKLTVKVMPNPASYFFTVTTKSLSKENVKLTVMDITGRVIEQKTDVPANSTIQLGDKYHPGIYIAEFMQGKDKIILRLIKEGK